MKTIRDIFGPPSHQPFAFYDPGSSSVKTSQATLLSDSTPCSVTLPKWGSMFGGALYAHPTPVPRTSGHGSFGLLPTPAAQEPGGTAQAHLDRKNRIDGASRVTPTHLSLVMQLLPTPAVNDMGEGKTPEAWDQWTQAQREKRRNGNGRGRSLSIEAQLLLPTPRTSDANGEGKHGDGGMDLRTSIGALTRPPSDDGNTPSDGPPHGQLTIEAA